MEVTIGKEGLTKTWQAEFPETTKCNKCKKLARIGFVAHEGMSENDRKAVHICLQRPIEESGLWPHDCTSFAIYICRKCMNGTVIWNQA